MYDIVQLNNAIELGCDYSMVYIAKNENEYFLEEAMELKDKTNSNIHLVAASFRTKNDVKRAIKSGVEYSTIPPRILDISLKNLQVENDYIF
jgi:transaldolase